MSDSPEISTKMPPRVVKTFLFVTALTIGLFGCLVWQAWNTFHYLKTSQNNYFRLTELSGSIVHLDEVLTMSARMAAATGELKWEARYRGFEAKLDAAIKEAMALGHGLSLKEAAEQTNTANLKLVEMENQAFDLVRKGQTEKASAILSSPEYDLQKRSYISGLSQITETIRSSMGEDFTKYHHRVYWAISSILIVTPCLIFGWILVAGLIGQYNTNRRKTEEQLRESEERFRALFENIHLIGLVIDPADGAIVDVNPGALSFYGWSRNELLGKKMTDINTLPSEEILKEMDRALKEHRSHFLFRHRRSDGSIRDVEVYSGPIQTGAKKLLYSIIHDITARKQAEEELRIAYAQLHTFMDAISESAFLIDKAWRILAANETVAKRFNKTVPELIGSKLQDIFSPDLLLKRKQYLDEAVKTGKSVRFEDERMGRTIDNVIYPVFDTQGEVLALAVIGHDITERKKVEEALKEEHRRLQQALDEVRTLRGIVPICAHCKKIRDDKGYWNQVEQYISDHTEARFSHGICPSCLEKEIRKFES